MSKMSRSKGQRGEREFFALLSEQLGTCVRRNVDQVRNGGADGIEVPGWAIEVKRWERGFLSEWWEQAQRQAGGDRWPALAYRANHQPWRVRVWLKSLTPAGMPVHDAPGINDPWVEMDASTFAYIVRESM